MTTPIYYTFLKIPVIKGSNSLKKDLMDVLLPLIPPNITEKTFGKF
jgi:hypothetical protein